MMEMKSSDNGMGRTLESIHDVVAGASWRVFSVAVHWDPSLKPLLLPTRPGALLIFSLCH